MVANVVALTAHAQTSNDLETQRTMTIKAKNSHEDVSKRFSELSTQKTTIDTSLREERLKTEQLQTENESLKVKLQVKKEAEAKAKSVQAARVQTIAPAVQVSGNKASWLAASGIPEAHWGYVNSIVTRESGWNPNAVNKSSGACGLGQQLPCGKWSGAWNDPVAALKAMTGYVTGRYGGWPQAVAFWNANHWY